MKTFAVISAFVMLAVLLGMGVISVVHPTSLTVTQTISQVDAQDHVDWLQAQINKNWLTNDPESFEDWKKSRSMPRPPVPPKSSAIFNKIRTLGVESGETISIQSTVDSLEITGVEINRGNCQPNALIFTRNARKKAIYVADGIIEKMDMAEFDRLIRFFTKTQDIDAEIVLNRESFAQEFPISLKFGEILEVGTINCSVILVAFDSDHGGWHQEFYP